MKIAEDGRYKCNGWWSSSKRNSIKEEILKELISQTDRDQAAELFQSYWDGSEEEDVTTPQHFIRMNDKEISIQEAISFIKEKDEDTEKIADIEAMIEDEGFILSESISSQKTSLVEKRDRSNGFLLKKEVKVFVLKGDEDYFIVETTHRKGSSWAPTGAALSALCYITQILPDYSGKEKKMDMKISISKILNKQNKTY